MSVNSKIKELKDSKGLTSAELSVKSGVPLGTLNKILSESTKSIKTETLQSIANALEVSLDAFSDFEREEIDGEINYGFVRVSAVTPELILGNVFENASNIKKLVKELNLKSVKVAVFPELSLTGYTVGDLIYQDLLLKNVEKNLENIRDFSKDYDMLFFVGAPLMRNGKLYNTAVAFHRGNILGVTPKKYLPSYNEFYEKRYFSSYDGDNGLISICGKNYPFGVNLIYCNSSFDEFKVGVEICEDLWAVKSPSVEHCVNGADIICNLSCSDELVCKAEHRRNLIKAHTSKCVCAYLYANAGTGESTTDMTFSGHNIIAENGKILTESKLFKNGYIISDVDLYYLNSERKKLYNYDFPKGNYEYIYFDMKVKSSFEREYSKTPFIPSKKEELFERIESVLQIQAEGLKRRIVHTNAKSLVIGISGGLDSTLALLVAVKAIDELKKDRKDIIGVIMPCFGTSERTKNNARTLLNCMGVSVREIDITESVKTHFKDIGHAENVTDVTYENAQARERTQVLMDVANMTGGLVIGTGDLSEIALGWSTYNGDHMSMYGVNSSVPKTLIKHIIKYIAEKSAGELQKVLLDVVDTPVSPELLPVNGEKSTQETENIVGPYVLHDFFLYYFVKMNFAPSKIFKIAEQTFKDDYTAETVYKWLEIFIKRFFNQQFKRSCMPDGVKVGSVALSPRGDFRMPSDLDKQMWLNDLERVKP